MAGKKPQRVPFAPLEALIASRWPDDSRQIPPGRRCTDGHIAEHLGVWREVVARARRDQITWQTADNWAVAIGVHPAELWPEMFGPDAA